jgi:hypothetical protein
LGSDGWLAKKRQSKTSGQTLVPSGGGEPLDAGRFLPLVKEMRDSVLNHAWVLYDLRGNAITK